MSDAETSYEEISEENVTIGVEVQPDMDDGYASQASQVASSPPRTSLLDGPILIYGDGQTASS